MDFVSYYKGLSEEERIIRTPKQEFREKIASACGVAPSTVMRWISGEITPDKLKREKVSEVLNIPVEELWPNLEIEEVI